MLQRKKIRNEQIQNYLSNVVTECPDFKASLTPHPNRLVSLASLNWEVNDVVSMDYLFPDTATVLAVMGITTCVSVGAVFDSTLMENVTYHMEILWLAHS